MSILAQVIQVTLSAMWGWYFFLSPLLDYSRALSWYPYLVTAGWISMFFLFLKIVRQGEEGYLKFVAWDLNTICKEGAYWPLNFFPFLQGVDFAAGFTIVVNRFSTLGSVAGNPNIFHYHDQNLSSLQFRATTDSLAKANFFHDLNRLKNWVFSFRDEEGRFRYYKLGSYLYLMCWIFAFFGNLGTHATQVKNEVVSTVTSAVSSVTQAYAPPSAVSKKTVSVTVQLDTGMEPVWPDWELFVPTREKDVRYFEQIEGKKYFLYSEPTPDTKDVMTIRGQVCAVIPVGREVYFDTDRRPIFAANMDPLVKFRKKTFGFALTKFFDPILLQPEENSWAFLYENWNNVEISRYNFYTKAKMSYELSEPAGGGLVCF